MPMKISSRHVFPGLLLAGLMVCGFFWLREEVTSRIYRQKLETLAGEYAALAEQYNYAVRQSAITELEVTESSITVLIRTIDGQVRRVPTPYLPDREIFIDYLVGQGRIWIRRIFDQQTAPEDALVIDPIWEVVDWQDASLQYGKVIYRSLSPGIWSIQVSGNGSLSLEEVEASRPEALAADLQLRSFEEIRLSMDEEAKSITLQDMWRFCLSGFSD